MSLIQGSSARFRPNQKRDAPYPTLQCSSGKVAVQFCSISIGACADFAIPGMTRVGDALLQATDAVRMNGDPGQLKYRPARAHLPTLRLGACRTQDPARVVLRLVERPGLRRTLAAHSPSAVWPQRSKRRSRCGATFEARYVSPSSRHQESRLPELSHCPHDCPCRAVFPVLPVAVARPQRTHGRDFTELIGVW